MAFVWVYTFAAGGQAVHEAIQELRDNIDWLNDNNNYCSADDVAVDATADATAQATNNTIIDATQDGTIESAQDATNENAADATINADQDSTIEATHDHTVQATADSGYDNHYDVSQVADGVGGP